jgi:hypothetical protein
MDRACFAVIADCAAKDGSADSTVAGRTQFRIYKIMQRLTAACATQRFAATVKTARLDERGGHERNASDRERHLCRSRSVSFRLSKRVHDAAV